jgi:hypothetical protein
MGCPPTRLSSASPSFPSLISLPLLPSFPSAAVGSNLRKLHAAKRAFNRYKPKAVIYVDRLDVGRRDQADVNVS